MPFTMQNKAGFALLTLALCGSAIAWNFDLSTLGLTQKELETRARIGLQETSAELEVPRLADNYKQIAKGLSEADRAAAVQAIGAALKAIVTSEAFQKAHNESIKTSYKAVDHGLKVYTMEEIIQMALKPQPGVDPAQDMQRQSMAKTAIELRKQPLNSVKMMFEDSLKTWTRIAQTGSSPASKAKALKMKTRALEIQPLIESKPDEFIKAYSVLYSMDNDGPGTEDELVALANRGQLEEEQRAYKTYNWKGVLKKKLETVVTVAATVDFAAQTADTGGRKKFVNQAYERKSSLWKAMFRAGKAPTVAAAEFAKAWMKEL